jgi:hypothetical protein
VMIEWQVPELPMTLRLQARGRYLVQIDSVLLSFTPRLSGFSHTMHENTRPAAGVSETP